MRIRLADWIRIFLSTLLSAIAFAAAAQGRHSHSATATAAFFGFTTAFAAWLIWQRLATRQMPGERFGELIGCTDIGVRRGHLFFAALVVVATGWLLFWGGTPRLGAAWGIISLLIVLTGCALVGALWIGWIGSAYIRFQPEGLRMGNQLWSYFVTWTDIRALALTEKHGHLILLIELHESALLGQHVTSPGNLPRARQRLENLIAKNQRRYGCDIALVPSQYGLNGSHLLEAMRGYVSQPETRGKLVTTGETL